jgi:hypothetical protein
MVENFDLLIASVVHVYLFLLPVGRKTDPPGGAPIVQETLSSLDPNVILEISHLIEDLDPVGLPITDINQALVADDHTMHNLHESTTSHMAAVCGLSTILPGAQVFISPYPGRR